MNTSLQKLRGFTVLELMIVIAIIGLLAALILPAIANKNKGLSEALANGWHPVTNDSSSGVNPAGSQPGDQVIRHDNVVRIFMHEANRYTLYFGMPNSQELKVWDVSLTPRIFADVKPGEPMWTQMTINPHKLNRDLEIHIHSDYTQSDLAGGEWSKRVGKMTVRGQTVEVGQ